MPTQSSDVIATGLNDGIDFTLANQTWTIDPGILVYSPSRNGVFSGFSGSTLINNGVIKNGTMASFVGASFGGSGAAITNNPGAEIIGGTIGLAVHADGAVINNGGAVMGLNEIGIVFDVASAHVVLTNTGDVFGSLYGVYAVSHLDGGVIGNLGVISSHYGIYVATAAGLVTTVLNTAAGVIRGTIDAIRTIHGAISLTNHGTLAGAIDCTAAGQTDVVVNAGAIQGPVFLGPGNDVYNGHGGRSGAVYGEAGNDRLIGGRHNDSLHGGDGKDNLTGGPGRDHFVFDTALGPGNIDRITDFTHGVDKIDLSHAIFTATNASGTLRAAMFWATGSETASTRILYHPGNGFLFYDQDGSGHAHAPVHFATLAAHLALTHADFLVVA